MTLQDCQKLVRDAGFTNFYSADWENDHHIYAFSVESHGAATYGHPKYTVHFSKFSGWLEETGKPAVNVHGASWRGRPEHHYLPSCQCTACKQRLDAEIAQRQHEYDESEKRRKRNAKARSRRRAKASAMDSIGMKRVSGNLGGSYWE